VIAIIATVAKQERVRISQRVKAGLETARAKGKRLGRPRVILDAHGVASLRAQGMGWKRVAGEFGLGAERSIGSPYAVPKFRARLFEPEPPPTNGTFPVGA